MHASLQTRNSPTPHRRTTATKTVRKMGNIWRLSEHDRNNDEDKMIAGVALKSSLVSSNVHYRRSEHSISSAEHRLVLCFAFVHRMCDVLCCMTTAWIVVYCRSAAHQRVLIFVPIILPHFFFCLRSICSIQ